MDTTVFRENLSNLIRSHGYTPYAFSVELNITPSTVHRHLSGDRIPDTESIIKYSQFFQVSIDWLLGLSTERDGPSLGNASEIVNLYALATEEDRKVVDLLLSKYKSPKE